MLKSLRIKNFKAVRDSKAIRLTPLTVFIGNNGSGKSSIIEALETYKTIVESNEEFSPIALRLPDDISCVSSFADSELKIDLHENITQWQFLNLNPSAMVNPTPQKRSGGQIYLAKDGSNIAEYLLSIQSKYPSAFIGIIETLQYVLSYARDLQPKITSELERRVYLQLTEANFKVPSWLFSTGTLRILSSLAVLRHPTPPPLIVIEEIENG
jgi:predicted ATPase